MLEFLDQIDRLEKRIDRAFPTQARQAQALTEATGPNVTFRAFLESPNFCQLALSPLVAGIADASEARLPDTLSDEQSAIYFGCGLDGLPKTSPRTVAVRAGARGGKTSRLLSTKAIHAAWTVPLPTINPGEFASSVIVAPDLKLARQALSFVHGYVEQSPVLRAARIGESKKDSVELRRPDGKAVRIEILAAGGRGRALRGRVLVYVGLDEAAFFFDESTGVINDAELYLAVLPRIAPGGQCWIVSTPWIADRGLLEKLLSENFGTHEKALTVIAPTRALNPTWDPTGEVERDLRSQDPDKAAREIDAIPMTGGSMSFIPPDALAACVEDYEV